jgi:hypothetical protein
MSKMGQTIEGLTEQICTNEQQVLQLVHMAKGNRVVGERARAGSRPRQAAHPAPPAAALPPGVTQRQTCRGPPLRLVLPRPRHC